MLHAHKKMLHATDARIKFLYFENNFDTRQCTIQEIHCFLHNCNHLAGETELHNFSKAFILDMPFQQSEEQLFATCGAIDQLYQHGVIHEAAINPLSLVGGNE